MAQVLYVDYAFISVRNNRAVKVVHDAADGVSNPCFLIVCVAQHHLFPNRTLIGPITLCERLAHHYLVGRTEHLLAVTCQQAVVEKRKEVLARNQHFGISLLTLDVKCHTIASHRAPVFHLRKAVFQSLAYTEVRHHAHFVANDESPVSTRLVVLYRCLTVDEVAQQQQEGHREAKPYDIDNGKQPMLAQEFQIAVHFSLFVVCNLPTHS